ncbi:MAG: BACON domain-containing protein [Bryobacteraceae bacterium]
MDFNHSPSGLFKLSVGMLLALSGAHLNAQTLQVSTNELLFTTPQGSQETKTVTVSFSGGAGGTVSAVANAPGAIANWLGLPTSPVRSLVVPAGGTATLQVGVSTTALQVGAAYFGTITLTATGSPSQTINVTANPSSAGTTNSPLSVNPASLTFAADPAGSNPAAQTVNVTVNTANTSSQSVTFNVQEDLPWLTASAPTATATISSPAALNFTADKTLLNTGTHTGTVTLTPTSPAGPVQTISVTFNVGTTTGSLLLGPTSSFTFITANNVSVPPAQQLSVTSNVSGMPNLSYTATASPGFGGLWLRVGTTSAQAVTQLSAQTPTTLYLSIDPTALAGLAVGTYTNNLLLSYAAETFTVSVQLNVGTAGTSQVTVNPASLAFADVPAGSATAVTQTLAVTSTDGTLQSFTAFPSSTGGWLTVAPQFGTTPQNLTVSVNPTLLATPGNYPGTITVTPTTGLQAGVPLNINITVTVVTGFTANPASLTFTQAGAAPPAAQTVQITSSSANVNFTTNATTTSGGNWLSVTPASGTTPGSLTVNVNGTGLAAGTYNGTIAVSGGSASQLSIPVTLTVSSTAALTLAPASLTFDHIIGQPAPATQTVAVGSSGEAISFTAATATTNGGAWLGVDPVSGTSPANLNVLANPTGLAAGEYTGTVTISGTGATNSPQTVNVTLKVSAVQPPAIRTISNAATFGPTAISPGLIITIGGTNLGPATGVPGEVGANSTLSTTLAETQVLFDNIPAPLLYVKDNQINAIAPYELFGRFNSRVVVERMGLRSEPVDVRIVDTAPGIFTLDASGRGQGAILNQNGSVNGPSNPAEKGSVVVFYATGEGQTNPAGTNGLVVPANNLRRPLANVRVFISGQEARLEYAGSAPGLVSGAVQVNAVVPPGAASGGAIPVEIQIGGSPSQAGVTMAIR